MPCVIFLFYYTVVEREAYSTGAPFTQFIPWNAKHIPMGRPIYPMKCSLFHWDALYYYFASAQRIFRISCLQRSVSPSPFPFVYRCNFFIGKSNSSV